MKLILGNQNEICNQNSAETSDSPLVMNASESGCKPVFLNFNGGNLSSNAGVLALKQVDRQLGLTEAMAKCMNS